MKNRFDSQVGFKRGLVKAGAKPATPSHASVYNKIDMMARADGEKISSGGDADLIRQISGEKLKMYRQKVRDINMSISQEAAARFERVSESIRKRYENNPSARLADIEDARARFGIMGRGEVKAMADAFLSGEKVPRSEYELIETIKHAPKHELSKAYAERDDFAFWVPEGKEAFEQMRTYAQLGDRVPFEAEDGSLIQADLKDLYLPPKLAVEDIARSEFERANAV